jgi:hypothetical protein
VLAQEAPQVLAGVGEQGLVDEVDGASSALDIRQDGLHRRHAALL